jgi:hypothetical protein
MRLMVVFCNHFFVFLLVMANELKVQISTQVQIQSAFVLFAGRTLLYIRVVLRIDLSLSSAEERNDLAR